MTRPATLALLAALLLPSASAAQAPASQMPAAGPNGGTMVTVEGHGVEMVANGTELALFLTDEGGAPAAARAGARAVVQEGGRTTTVPLTPGAPNRLVGVLPAPLGQGARVVVSATLADGHQVQARFVK